ncbi:hypothetical protein GTP56_06005 [Duganella sp. FT134W]|uniref:TniQ protein n=1 Tax=Duganella margarita TaxID=2692170 RepID=A0A7X4KEV7_9BURK|nr:hypothetical protein [Duganella margarita]MYM71751.1 hypothetical protein [Duganella margarita]
MNHLTWPELGNLIKNPGAHVPGRIESSNTRWVDFERFASLLRITSSRLKQGCRDELGLDADGDLRGIRICPQCWGEAYYHSVFFDLGILDECPFHKCKLRSPCKRCTSQLRFSLRLQKAKGTFEHHCVGCKSTTPGVTELIKAASLGFDFTETFEQEGAEFLNWWKQFGKLFPARDILGSQLLYGRTVLERTKYSKYLPWVRYIANTSDPYHLPPWLPSEATSPSKYVHWLENMSIRHELVMRDTANQELWASDMAHSYRGLKKYIYARFIRPHARCYHEMLKLRWQQCQSLDGEDLCPTAVAFIAWRMAVEGVIRVQDLRGVRQRGFEFRLFSIPKYSGMSMEGKLRWSYYMFLSLWFEMLQKKHIRIMFSLTNGSSQFPYQCVPCSQIVSASGVDQRTAIHLLVPDAGELTVRGHGSCHGFSAKSVKNIPDGEYCSDFSQASQCLFQIAFYRSGSRSYNEVWL